jgi:hypothetical protein
MENKKKKKRKKKKNEVNLNSTDKAKFTPKWKEVLIQLVGTRIRKLHTITQYFNRTTYLLHVS